jgi:hypothetical protein
MITKQQNSVWSGLRVLITSNGHEHYNRVATIVGSEESADGRRVIRGQLGNGQEIVFSEGQYKVISLQN